MNIKFGLIAATAVFSLVTVSPAFASFHLSNWASLNNIVTTTADTGHNMLTATGNGNTIGTGDAMSQGLVTNAVNRNALKPCGCTNKSTIKNGAIVLNNVTTIANTGNNNLDTNPSEVSTGGSILTGDAVAGTEVDNVVNTNVTH